MPSHLAKPAMLVAEAGIEPAADEAYETPALPTELFRREEGGCPSWVRTKPPEFKARCPTSYAKGQRDWCHVRDSNPRHPI